MKSYKVRNSFSIIIAILFLIPFSLFSQSVLQVGEVSALPGEKKSGYINVPGGEDDGPVRIPVTVINGIKDGPTLALIAGVHGYEYPPVLAMTEISKMVEAAEISGKIIIVHVAHIPSFLKRTVYYNPYDWQNFNRVFPGKVDGASSERIAFQVTKEVIDKCDYLIDNHCGDGNEDLMRYLYFTETGNPELDVKTRGLAESFNLPVIVHETGRTKDVQNSMYVSNTALLRGKPAISTEVGKLGQADESDVNEIIRGNFNIMKHLGMMEGKPEILFESVWVEEYQIIRSEKPEGLFYPLVSRGDHVQEGQLVGYLNDYFGKRLQDVRSPYDGIVLYIIATPPMSEGEPMVMIGAF